MVTRHTCLAVFGALFLRSIAVAQTSDITPPTLVSLTFNPTVDVTAASQNVPITAHVTDDLSGVNFIQVAFVSPVFGASQTQIQFVDLSPPFNSPPFLNGNLQGSLPIPRYSENGTWRITSVFMGDNAGNRKSLSTSDLQAAGIPTTLNVTSIPDTTPPQVTNISLSSSSIDVSSGPQPLTVTLTLTDDVSGANPNADALFGVVGLRSPSGIQEQILFQGDFSLISGTNLNGSWRATHTIPRYSEAGTWTIDFISLEDNAANFQFLDTPQLSSLGLTTTFAVVSSRSDTTPPTITGFDFTPKLFDTSNGPQAVTVTFNVTDDLSGADLSTADRFCEGVQFVSPSGGQVNFSCFLQLTAGTPLNGTWQGSVFFPQYEESGTWKASIFRVKDTADNLLSLSTAQMAALNFPVELAIFKPTVVATIGPNGGTVMDPTFGTKAEITIPKGMLQGPVMVAIQVLTNPLTDVPTPLGFSTGPGTLFVDFTLTPPINNDPFFVVPPPGVTLVLPLAQPMTPGSTINLWRFDPNTKMLVAVPNAITGAPVVGTVNMDGLSATFLNVGHLSIFVGLIPTDKTPPVIVPHISGTPGSNGWYRNDVTVTWDLSDPESLIYSSTGCGLTKLTSETAGTTLTCTATNFAGLSNSVQVTIKIDRTPPVISGMPAASCSLWPPDHKLVQVAFVTASDTLSGLDKNLFKVTGTSNEAPNPGEQDVVITPLGFTGPTTNGAPGYIVQLRADRSGNGNGRIYTITATATDLAGNSSAATATCVVPHDQGKGK